MYKGIDQMGPFHFLLDEMGLDKERIHQILYVARPVLTQLELGWVISAFIATAFTMLHMSLYVVFMEHASQESRSVFSVAVCKIQVSKCYTESSQREVQCT